MTSTAASAPTTGSTSPAASRAQRKRPLIAVAAATLVLVAAVVSLLLWQSPGRSTGLGSTAAGPAVAQLTLGGAQAKCMAPRARILAGSADFAFAGTVVRIKGNVVILRLTRIYSASIYGGKIVAQVEVHQTSGSSEELLGPSGNFEQGQAYLVASSDGRVMTCGYSGTADTAGLQQLYNEAFETR